jgi:hypothetical protein
VGDRQSWPKMRREADELRWMDWKISSTESPLSSANRVEAASVKLPN